MTNTYRVTFIADDNGKGNRAARRFFKHYDRKVMRQKHHRIEREAVRQFYADVVEEHFDYMVASGYYPDEQFDAYEDEQFDAYDTYEDELFEYMEDIHDYVYDPWEDEYLRYDTGPTRDEMVIWVNENKEIFENLNADHVVKRFGVTRFEALLVIAESNASMTLGDILENARLHPNNR